MSSFSPPSAERPEGGPSTEGASSQSTMEASSVAVQSTGAPQRLERSTDKAQQLLGISESRDSSPEAPRKSKASSLLNRLRSGSQRRGRGRETSPSRSDTSSSVSPEDRRRAGRYQLRAPEVANAGNAASQVTESSSASPFSLEKDFRKYGYIEDSDEEGAEESAAAADGLDLESQVTSTQNPISPDQASMPESSHSSSGDGRVSAADSLLIQQSEEEFRARNSGFPPHVVHIVVARRRILHSDAPSGPRVRDPYLDYIKYNMVKSETVDARRGRVRFSGTFGPPNPVLSSKEKGKGKQPADANEESREDDSSSLG